MPHYPGLKIKIHGGTAEGGDSSLCTGCTYATTASGARWNEKIVKCRVLEREIEFPVKACTSFKNYGIPSVNDMEELAWVLKTDVRTKQIGFMSPDKRKKDDDWD